MEKFLKVNVKLPAPVETGALICAKFFVPCLVESGTMPLVPKTIKTFFLAKTRYRYYSIHTSIPPCPQTPP